MAFVATATPIAATFSGESREGIQIATNSGFISYIQNGGEDAVRKLYEQEKLAEERRIAAERKSLEQRALQSLAFPEMYLRENAIDTEAPETCAWILEHETYATWLSERKGLLWIKGKPGAGKTTLLKYALQESKGLVAADELMVASYFFDGRGAPIQKNPLGLFRCLLFQVLSHFPDLLSEFGVVYKNKCDTEGGLGKVWEWSVAEMRKHLLRFLSRASAMKNIRIYVDALDESGEEPAREMVAYFRRLTQLPGTERSISICFSCRNYPLTSVEDSLTICVEDENYMDIVTFVVERLDEFPRDQAEKLSVTIVNRASGVFQWVVLVVPKLLRLYRQGKNMKVIEAKLMEIPLELGNFYQEILEDVDKDDLPQSLQLMQWLCFSCRPLSLEELRWAMAMDKKSSYDSLDECKSSEEWVETDDAMVNRLNYLSGGLAEVVLAEIVESEYEGSDDGEDDNEKTPNEEVNKESSVANRSRIEEIDGETENGNDLGKADPVDSAEKRSSSSPSGKVRRVAQFIHQSVEDYLISSGLEKLDDFAKRSVIGRGHQSLLMACVKYISMQEILSLGLELEHRQPSGRKLLTSGDETGAGDEKEIQRGTSTPLLNTRREKSIAIEIETVESCGPVGPHLQHERPALSAEPLEEKPSKDGPQLIVSEGEEEQEARLVRLAIELQQGQARVHASGGESSKMGAHREQSFSDDTLFEKISSSDNQQLAVYEASKSSSVHQSSNTFDQVDMSRNYEIPNQVYNCFVFLDTDSDANNGYLFRDISDDHQWDVDKNQVITDGDKRKRDRRWAMWRFPLLHYAVKYCISHIIFAEEQRIPQGNLVEVFQTPKLVSRSASPNRQRHGRGVSPNQLSDQMITPWRCLHNLMGVLSSIDEPYVPTNTTLLHLGSRYSLISVVKELLDPGYNIDVEPRDSEGWTPLFYAAQHGHNDVVRLLLDTGKVNPDAESDDRWTPLSLAAKHGNEAVIKMLLNTGKVDVDRRDEMGRTALFWAARFGTEAVVQLLLDTGMVDANLIENTGHTLLSWATEEMYQDTRPREKAEYIAIVQLLLISGKINMGKNDEGQTLLSIAAEKGHDILVQQLLQTGRFEVDSRDAKGQTPLSISAYYGHENVVKTLLRTGKADVNSEDDMGRSPLSLALSWVAYIKMLKVHDDEDKVRLRLATRKLNIKPEDIAAWTSRLKPYSLATSHLAVARLLLDTGKISAGPEAEWIQPPLSWIKMDEKENEDMKAAQAASLARKREEDAENAELEAALAVSLLKDEDIEAEDSVYFKAAIAASLAKENDEDDQLTLAIALSLAKDDDEEKEMERPKAVSPATPVSSTEKNNIQEDTVGKHTNGEDYNDDDDLELAIALSLALAEDIEQQKQAPQNSLEDSHASPSQQFTAKQVSLRPSEKRPAPPAPKPKPERLTQASPGRQATPTPQPKPEHLAQPQISGTSFGDTKPARLSPEPKPKPKHLMCT